tara:strand:+ start:61 stop:486 length:426 start_codon:yes stop_codon:yes gene_type:complete
MSENISIKSNQIDIISSKDNVKINSNTFIHLSSNDSIKMETKIENKIENKQSKIWLSSPIIQLGVETTVNKYQPIVKGDDLEKELIEIYNVLLQIVRYPGAQIAAGTQTSPNPFLISFIQFKKDLFTNKVKTWKSTVSKTV